MICVFPVGSPTTWFYNANDPSPSGLAKAGTTVKVSLGCEIHTPQTYTGTEIQTAAPYDGRWQVTLMPRQAGGHSCWRWKAARKLRLRTF